MIGRLYMVYRPMTPQAGCWATDGRSCGARIPDTGCRCFSAGDSGDELLLYR
jgi:hypothetical protein